MNRLDVVIYGAKAGACFASLQLDPDWKINRLGLDALGETPTPSGAETLVVFCDDSIDQNTLCQVLGAAAHFSKYPIRICFFCTPPTTIHHDLALQFSDFIFFPSSSRELKLRLALLRKQHLETAQPFDVAQRQPLLEEFAALNLRGNSQAFTDTLLLIKQTAKCDAPVLIEGETGTGKENAARAIHYFGKRQDSAFVPINCGAIPDTLLESELFGYEKGAFTDAKQRQSGLVALANNGTLFLDEVDSLSPRAQAALLRFLQTGEYRPLGGNHTLQSNVRVVAATNADLAARVRHKEFREDLYFRLNVLYVRMPPLRERPDDIEVIADYLVRKYLGQYGSGPTRIHPSFLLRLQGRSWPGNVRELENVLLREFLLANGEQIMGGASTLRVNDARTQAERLKSGPPTFQAAKEEAISRFETSYLQSLLALTAGNVSEAARLAGKERRCLGKLIKKYQIDKSRFVEPSAP
ncbi:MAG TPA: sigma-54 dependent transcriptional regulator [Hyphomicrobiales bacterium]|nr:sigma-54 dependent transcriptional regulator [Hyphomicrobiales bacterium]